uniref:Uncharacterized protein n=1 Tax=Ditylenchus dipsaci TaxID=166011 RepID=A0A915EF46_9BILA
MRHSSDRQYPDNNKSLPPVHSYERNKLLEEFAEDCSEHEYSLNYTSSPNVFPKTRRRTTECDDDLFNSKHRYSEPPTKPLFLLIHYPIIILLIES